jgi:hypothetical protein
MEDFIELIRIVVVLSRLNLPIRNFVPLLLRMMMYVNDQFWQYVVISKNVKSKSTVIQFFDYTAHLTAPFSPIYTFVSVF